METADENSLGNAQRLVTRKWGRVKSPPLMKWTLWRYGPASMHRLIGKQSRGPPNGALPPRGPSGG